MVPIRVRALLAVVAALAGRPAGSAAQAPASVVVIVNATVPARSLTRAEVRRIFLLRERFWSDGQSLAPVNGPAGSPLRESFSRAVLGGSTQSFATYWNDLYFHGTAPPPTLESEQAVLLYVARTAGAIGYVSDGAAAQLPPEVRPVLTVSP